ncbi:MAG: hypothetical protein R3E68_05225 [Burkholderiaceae bacterium]
MVASRSLQAPVLFTIAEDLGRMEVRVDRGRGRHRPVKEGQQAVFTVDAFADRCFNARIRTLRYGSQVVQGVVTYKAVLDTDNQDLLLRPGMTATAEITVLERNDVLTGFPTRPCVSAPRRTALPRMIAKFFKKLLPGMPRAACRQPEPNKREPIARCGSCATPARWPCR